MNSHGFLKMEAQTIYRRFCGGNEVDKALGSDIAFRLPLDLPVALSDSLASGMEEWPGVGCGEFLVLK